MERIQDKKYTVKKINNIYFVIVNLAFRYMYNPEGGRGGILFIWSTPCIADTVGTLSQCPHYRESVIVGVYNVQSNLHQQSPFHNSHLSTTATSLQQPNFLVDSPYVDSCLNLSTMAIFFCPQGDH